MRENNASRVFDHFVIGQWDYRKDDTMRAGERLDDEAIIYDCGTPIAILSEKYSNIEDSYIDYITITLQDYKSQPTWKAHRKQLVQRAIELGWYILFVEELDIGFGKVNKSNIDYYKSMRKIQKICSASEAINVVALTMTNSNYDKELVAYAIDSTDNDNNIISGISILSNIVELDNTGAIPYTITSLYMLDYKSLQLLVDLPINVLEYYKTSIVDIMIKDVKYGAFCNNSYNENAKIQLINDIMTRTAKNAVNLPIKICHIKEKKK